MEDAQADISAFTAYPKEVCHGGPSVPATTSAECRARLGCRNGCQPLNLTLLRGVRVVKSDRERIYCYHCWVPRQVLHLQQILAGFPLLGPRA